MDQTTPTYPEPFHTFYDRAVWPMGEDCDEGVMVEGHGRRALAALNAYCRDEDGTSWRLSSDGPINPEEKWVRFFETCGCTEDQHAGHADLDGGCDDACDRYGLPPCDPDRFAWQYDYTEPNAAGALPVTMVSW